MLFVLRSVDCERPWSDLGPARHGDFLRKLDALPEPDSRSRTGLHHVCTVQTADGPRQIAVEYEYKRRLRKVFTVRCLEYVTT